MIQILLRGAYSKALRRYRSARSFLFVRNLKGCNKIPMVLNAFIAIFHCSQIKKPPLLRRLVPRTGLLHDPGTPARGLLKSLSSLSRRRSLLFVRNLKACNKIPIVLNAFIAVFHCFQIKKPPQLRRLLCPGLDSNQHALSGTTTSKWLVYQFQHLGEKGVQI